MGFTRRRALAVTVGAALAAAPAGCGLFDGEPQPAPEPDPLQPILDDALALALAHERAAVAQPSLADRLVPLAEDHRAHASELARVIGTAAPATAAIGTAAPATAPSASAPPPAATLADLRAAERAAQRTATAAARTAQADRAGLVGSIAACRATHVEALK